MVDRAVTLFADMTHEGVQPDAVAYNTIVNGCVFSGRLLSACEILSQAISQKVRLADDTYDNVLRNFMINRRMSVEQKRRFAAVVCKYVRECRVPVNPGNLRRVSAAFLAGRHQF